MSTHTMRPTLQTVPESLPADHVTQPSQPAGISPTNNATPTTGAVTEKLQPTSLINQSTPTPAVSLKPRSSSSRVSYGILLLRIAVNGE